MRNLCAKVGFGLILLPVVVSCLKDKTPPVDGKDGCQASYSDVISPLVITKCALQGCHVGGFPFGDFNSYADLKERVDNGKIQRLVLEKKIMPPAGSVSLTSEEIVDLQCWIDNGAPKN